MKLIFTILRAIKPVRTHKLITVNYRTASHVPNGVDAHGNPKCMIQAKRMLVSVIETTFIFGWNIRTKNTVMKTHEIRPGEFEIKAAFLKEEIDTRFFWASEFFREELEKARNTVEPSDPERYVHFTDYYTAPN